MLDQSFRHGFAAVAATLFFIPTLIVPVANGAFAQLEEEVLTAAQADRSFL